MAKRLVARGAGGTAWFPCKDVSQNAESVLNNQKVPARMTRKRAHQSVNRFQPYPMKSLNPSSANATSGFYLPLVTADGSGCTINPIGKFPFSGRAE